MWRHDAGMVFAWEVLRLWGHVILVWVWLRMLSGAETLPLDWSGCVLLSPSSSISSWWNSSACSSLAWEAPTLRVEVKPLSFFRTLSSVLCCIHEKSADTTGFWSTWVCQFWVLQGCLGTSFLSKVRFLLLVCELLVTTSLSSACKSPLGFCPLWSQKFCLFQVRKRYNGEMETSSRSWFCQLPTVWP